MIQPFTFTKNYDLWKFILPKRLKIFESLGGGNMSWLKVFNYINVRSDLKVERIDLSIFKTQMPVLPFCMNFPNWIFSSRKFLIILVTPFPHTKIQTFKCFLLYDFSMFLVLSPIRLTHKFFKYATSSTYNL